MRVGVVGLGHYHVTGWVETLAGFEDELEFVALYDPDAERGRTLAPPHHDPTLPASLGERFRSLPVETRLDELISRHRLDIALVTLPNAAAPAAIVALAAAGIHQVIDKPAARSAAEARVAARHVRASGVRTVVGLTRRYAPAARAARELVASGSLGPLIAVEAVFAASSVAVRDPLNALFDREQSGGGILTWLGIHDIDSLLWLTGQSITEVSALTGSVGQPGLEVEDVASVGLRLDRGAIGTIQHSYSLPATGYRGQIAVRGRDGSVELGLDDDLVILSRSKDGRLVKSRRRFSVQPTGGYGTAGHAAVADLLGAIRDGHETAAPFDDLVRALEIVDAAYESARTGRHVRVAIRDGPEM